MPDVRDQAPDFTLFRGKGETVTLSELRGQKVVIAFFPAAFTGVCEKELCTFRDSFADLAALNATVLGISVDGLFANLAFARQNDLNFPLLTDYAREAVTAYGVALPNFAGLPGYTASERAVFIVDETGAISYKWVGENPGVLPDFDAIQQALA